MMENIENNLSSFNKFWLKIDMESPLVLSSKT